MEIPTGQTGLTGLVAVSPCNRYTFFVLLYMERNRTNRTGIGQLVRFWSWVNPINGSDDVGGIFKP